MKTSTYTKIPIAIVIMAGALFAAPLVRAEGHDRCGAAVVSDSAPPAAFDLARAKAAYPLDTCVVSGEKLEGDMGSPVDYVHKEAGKPDRLVRFCCKGCIKDFQKDPAKFLKRIDDAAAAKTPR